MSATAKDVYVAVEHGAHASTLADSAGNTRGTPRAGQAGTAYAAYSPIAADRPWRCAGPPG